MYKRWMHNRERHFAMLNDNRLVRPFEWGTEFLPESVRNYATSFEQFQANTNEVFKDTDAYYGLPKDIDYSYRTDSQELLWQSTIETPSLENNTARARMFPYTKDKKAAVLVLPHWNAQSGSYFNLCETFARFGVSSLRLTLPYHEERMPAELERADYLVSPNVGRSLESMRQAVLDTRAAIRWLNSEGFEKVGIVGTSIGSCVAFLAFVHDSTVHSAVFNHVSGYVADVVWRGLSTYHVREGMGDDITLDELRECWLPISPLAYIDRLAQQEPRSQRYIYTLYDLSFPIDLSLDTMEALRMHDIAHDETRIPCGHYTLGEKPWVYLDGYKIVSYLRRKLR